MNKVPNWVNALVAILLFLGSVSGVYVGLSNELAVLSSKVGESTKRAELRLKDLDSYQIYLQRQIDEGKRDYVMITTKLGYMEDGQKELAASFKELAVELRKTNEFLIEVKTKQKG